MTQISVWCEAGWLCFDAPLPGKAAWDYERLLTWNGSLPGAAKFCLSSTGEAHVRAEVPLRSEEDDGADRAPSMLAVLHQALVASELGEEQGWSVKPDAVLPVETPAVKQLCAEAGWPCLERTPGQWRVELEGTPSFCQAEITVQAGMLRLAAPLAEWETLPPPCAEALTHLLLTAGGACCMAGAAIEIQETKQRALLLVHLPFADVVTDLSHALSALSVGVRRLQREVGALQRPEIAGHYLAIVSTNPS